MKTLDELERIRRAGPDLLEALEAIVEGFRGAHPDPGHTWTPMTKYEAREIARVAIEKVSKSLWDQMSEAQHDRIVELEDALAKANRVNADLLAACRALVRDNDGPGEFGEALKLAQAAIAKATGAA